MNNRRRAEKALLTSVGFLSNCGMEADNGSHRHNTSGIVADVVTYRPTYFCMRIVGIRVFKLAFERSRLEEAY
jgi:hypothetical protein